MYADFNNIYDNLFTKIIRIEALSRKPCKLKHLLVVKNP